MKGLKVTSQITYVHCTVPVPGTVYVCILYNNTNTRIVTLNFRHKKFYNFAFTVHNIYLRAYSEIFQ